MSTEIGEPWCPAVTDSILIVGGDLPSFSAPVILKADYLPSQESNLLSDNPREFVR
jgi:hypothetical protein